MVIDRWWKMVEVSCGQFVTRCAGRPIYIYIDTMILDVTGYKKIESLSLERPS